MINDQQKHEIIALIEREKAALGSYSKVASKCSVAVATITNNMLNEDRWVFVKDAMWVKVGHALGFNVSKQSWSIVETHNYKLMYNILNMAQSDSLFMAISYQAGSGKSTAIRAYKEEDDTNSVFVLQCQEWTRKTFLQQLAQTLGIAPERQTVTQLSNAIVRTLKERAASHLSLIIIDEADKLKAAALRWLIHFYNELEFQVGCVLVGTDNLEKEIKRGTRNALKGYDELDSRLGRRFIHLFGTTFDDVQKICTANGVVEPEAINRVWQSIETEEKPVNGKLVKMAKCLRNLRLAIIRERRLSQLQNI